MAVKMHRRDINFTEGHIVSSLILFALPIIAGEILQNLYNSVDSLIVGNFVSEAALAAVGVCSTLSNLVVGFFNGMSVGSSVVVSRAFGGGDDARCRAAIRHTFTFSVMLGLVLSAVGILLAPYLLQLSGVNEEIFEAASVYLRIYMAGLTFTVMYNCGAGVLRAVGDSRNPFFILIISSAVNIGLDVLLVTVLPWGIVGVAIATVVSQLLSVVLIYLRMTKRLGVSCISVRDTFVNGRRTILEAMDIGFAAGLQGAFITFSNVFVWRYINLFDTASVAGITIAQRIDKFVNLPSKAFGLAMTTYVSQNVGAEQYSRMRSGIWRCMLLSFGTLAAMMLLITPNADFLSALFSDNAEVVTVSANMIRAIVPFYFFMAFREILLGVLRGNGRSRMPMLLSLVGMIGVRQLFLGVTLHGSMDIAYIFYCYPVGWGSAALLLLVYAIMVARKVHMLPSPEERTTDGPAD